MWARIQPTDGIVETDIDENGIKYVTEVRIKDGKRMRVTKKVRVGTKETKTSKRVLERKVYNE